MNVCSCPEEHRAKWIGEKGSIASIVDNQATQAGALHYGEHHVKTCPRYVRGTK